MPKKWKKEGKEKEIKREEGKIRNKRKKVGNVP
jgi:hypothetical protein